MSKRLSSKTFSAELAKLAVQLRADIEARVEGFAIDPLASARRRKRAMGDFGFFAKTYFPHFTSRHQSVLHKYLFDRLLRLGTTTGAGAHLAIAAPRGEAKSTLVSQIYIVWLVMTERTHYALIVMDAYGQAATMLETIKAELEVNRRLVMDFPHACGMGGLWREGVIVTRGGAKIEVFGTGKRVRGLRHGSHRPDLVVCDDLENDENVRSRTQRDKLEAWFKKSVLKLGPPDDSMSVVVIGTVLHHDSLLARLLRDPMWESMRFSAIIRWPDNMRLWEAWEVLLRTEGEKAADRYYRSSRAAMDAGSEVSWPGVRPIERLMKIRARDGADAFDSELQNSPLSANALFGTLHYWHEINPEWLYFGAVDPSMGKSGKKGDPSAILVGGFDRQTGRLHVVEADIQRRVPDKIIEDVIRLQQRFGCRGWYVETIQFQEMFKDELIKQSVLRGVPVPAKGVKPTTDKGLRITSLQPYIANGQILFRSDQTALLEQLRHYGESDCHDDGPDALQMLWAAATTGAGMLGEFLASGVKRVGSFAPGGVAPSGGGHHHGWGSVPGNLSGMEGYR